VAEDEPQVSEEELLEALKRLRVSDVLVQSLSTVSSLAFHRLAPETRDLEQARLAIETLRALAPVLRGHVPDDLIRDFEAVTASLQLAYAGAVEESAQATADAPGAEPDAPPG